MSYTGLDEFKKVLSMIRKTVEILWNHSYGGVKYDTYDLRNHIVYIGTELLEDLREQQQNICLSHFRVWVLVILK